MTWIYVKVSSDACSFETRMEIDLSEPERLMDQGLLPEAHAAGRKLQARANQGLEILIARCFQHNKSHETPELRAQDAIAAAEAILRHE